MSISISRIDFKKIHEFADFVELSNQAKKSFNLLSVTLDFDAVGVEILITSRRDLCSNYDTIGLKQLSDFTGLIGGVWTISGYAFETHFNYEAFEEINIKLRESLYNSMEVK